MQRKIYCACDSDFKSFYKSQAGHGFSDIEIFRGSPYQRGYGFGSLFRRFALPVLKYLGKQVLRTGVNVGQDVLDKRNLKESLKDRGRESFKTIAKDTLNKAGQLIEQSGQGIKRKRLYKKSKKTKKRKTKKKRKDIFG